MGARAYRKLVPIPPAATICSLGTRRTTKGGAGPPLLFEPSARLSKMTMRESLLIAVLVYLVRAVWGQGATPLRLGETYSFTLQSGAPQTFAYELNLPATEQVSIRATAVLVVLFFASTSTDFSFHIEEEKPAECETFFDVVVNLQVLGYFLDCLDIGYSILAPFPGHHSLKFIVLTAWERG